MTPSLRAALQEELAELYARARDDADLALREHGEDAAADALPATCPYGFEQITGEGWYPGNRHDLGDQPDDGTGTKA